MTDAWLIWGASTQGRPPDAPLDGTDASTNSVAWQQGRTLNALLAAYFPGPAPTRELEELERPASRGPAVKAT